MLDTSVKKGLSQSWGGFVLIECFCAVITAQKHSRFIFGGEGVIQIRHLSF